MKMQLEQLEFFSIEIAKTWSDLGPIIIKMMKEGTYMVRPGSYIVGKQK